ncbi:hypothetical protein ACNJUT_12730, partial [Mycobacterium tuberculosis]
RISATIRTARSRSSGGYLLDEPPDMTPSFPRTGVSGHAGAVQKNIPIHQLRRTGLLDKLLLLAGQPEESLAGRTVSDEVIDSLSPEALIGLALDEDENDIR